MYTLMASFSRSSLLTYSGCSARYLSTFSSKGFGNRTVL